METGRSRDEKKKVEKVGRIECEGIRRPERVLPIRNGSAN
jgi:hypothetical protein